MIEISHERHPANSEVRDARTHRFAFRDRAGRTMDVLVVLDAAARKSPKKIQIREVESGRSSGVSDENFDEGFACVDRASDNIMSNSSWAPSGPIDNRALGSIFGGSETP